MLVELLVAGSHSAQPVVWCRNDRGLAKIVICKHQSVLKRVRSSDLHPNAYELGAFESVPGTCEACGKGRALRYTGSFYAVTEVEYICPWCVADGTAARLFDGEFSDYGGIEGIPSEPGLPATVDIVEALECARARRHTLHGSRSSGRLTVVARVRSSVTSGRRISTTTWTSPTSPPTSTVAWDGIRHYSVPI